MSLEIYLRSIVPDAPEGPPILFVHGAFAGAWCWEEHFLPWFAKHGHEVHAVDLPGRRGRPDEDMLQSYSVHDYVDAVVAAVDQMREPPVVIGHSMGGYLAWRVAEMRTLAAVVLMAPVPPTGLAAPAMQLVMQNPSLFMDVARAHAGEMASPASLQQALFSDSVPDWLSESLIGRFQHESRLAVAGLYAGHIPNTVALWGTPMRVVGARRDQLIPPAHVQWTASLCGCSAHIYEDMGHGLMLEPGWEAVAADTADWLAEAHGI